MDKESFEDASRRRRLAYNENKLLSGAVELNWKIQQLEKENKSLDDLYKRTLNENKNVWEELKKCRKQLANILHLNRDEVEKIFNEVARYFSLDKDHSTFEWAILAICNFAINKEGFTLDKQSLENLKSIPRDE